VEIQQLRHLLAAASESSYAQAAKKCFTSRQNIAHSIKALENELGVTLFKRKGNEMVLAPEGEQVVQRAYDIITKIDSMYSMFVDPAALAMQLNIAISTNLFAGIPSSANALFMNYPGGIQIFELDCEDCYRSVCSEKVDAALIMCMERQFPECSVLEIASSMAYVLTSASSPLTQLTHLKLADLKDHRLLLMSEPDFQYEPLFAQLDSAGFARANVNVITSTSTMLHLIKRSQTASIISEKFAVNPPEGTVAIPLFDPQLSWRFYVLFQKRASNYRSLMKLAQNIQSLFGDDDSCGTAGFSTTGYAPQPTPERSAPA
jgi:DNA-binding transcriptional LysR family regulator